MGVKYEDMACWVRLLDVIINRVDIINQMLGCKRTDMSSPVQLSCKRGRYVCKVGGEPFCTWTAWDYESTDKALGRIEALNDGIWLLGRKAVRVM